MSYILEEPVKASQDLAERVTRSNSRVFQFLRRYRHDAMRDKERSDEEIVV